MDLNYADLFITLKWMWQGILILFACCGFIALVMFGLNQLAKLKKSSKDEVGSRK